MKHMSYYSVIFQAKTQYTQIRVDFPQNSNTEKKNIWHEKIVTSTYFETSENELTSKLQFLFTFSAHLIENYSRPECRKWNVLKQ